MKPKHTPFTLAREAAESPANEKVFLAAYRPVFLYLIIPSFILMVATFVATDPNPTLGRFLDDLLQSVLLPLTAVAVIAIPLTWFYRVRVQPEGIHGGTIWSTPVYMTFAEMETVEPRTLFGFSYLRVTSFRESCPPLWMPSLLADPEAFRETVVANSAPSNPLRRSLENGNTPEKREALTA